MRLPVLVPVLVSAFAAFSCRQASFDEQILKEAREYTEKQCPKRVADDVTLDSMTYTPRTRVVNYYYTVRGKLDDAKLFRDNESAVRENLLNSVKNSVEMRREKSKGIGFRYVYRSGSTGKKLIDVHISKGDYGE